MRLKKNLHMLRAHATLTRRLTKRTTFLPLPRDTCEREGRGGDGEGSTNPVLLESLTTNKEIGEPHIPTILGGSLKSFSLLSAPHTPNVPWPFTTALTHTLWLDGLPRCRVKLSAVWAGQGTRPQPNLSPGRTANRKPGSNTHREPTRNGPDVERSFFALTLSWCLVLAPSTW